MAPKNIPEMVNEVVRQTQLIAMCAKHLEKSYRTSSDEEEKINIEEQLNTVYFELKSIFEEYIN